MNEDELLQQYESQGGKQKIQERLDQISMFLEFVKKDELLDMIVSKEISIGIIKEEHMDGHINMRNMIMNFIFAGQLKTAKKLIYGMLGEFRTTMSIEGDFIRNVSKQEMRYTQYQHLYQHPTQPERRGLFRKRRPPQDVVRD